MINYEKTEKDVYELLLHTYTCSRYLKIGELGRYDKEGRYNLLMTVAPVLLSSEDLIEIATKINSLNKEIK